MENKIFWSIFQYLSHPVADIIKIYIKSYNNYREDPNDTNFKYMFTFTSWMLFDEDEIGEIYNLRRCTRKPLLEVIEAMRITGHHQISSIDILKQN